MSRLNPADRSGFSPPALGKGVRLIVTRTHIMDGPRRKPHRRIGPVYRVEPTTTCLICLGDPQIPCWHCRPDQTSPPPSGSP